MKYLYYIILLPALVLFSCKDNPANPEDFGEGEDYNIYKKVLFDRIGDPKTYVILGDSTVSEIYYSDTSFIRYIKEQAPGLSVETLQNYVYINQQKVKLKHIPTANNIIFSNEFPGNSDTLPHLYLSRIGYDTFRTQAVLTMGIVFGPLAGGGYLFFLTKKEDDWEITKIVGTWIS